MPGLLLGPASSHLPHRSSPCAPRLLPPAAGALLVNFDAEVLQLMREAQYMQRLGLATPPSARAVLLQEEKFGLYHAQLTHALRVRRWADGGWTQGRAAALGSERGPAACASQGRPPCPDPVPHVSTPGVPLHPAPCLPRPQELERLNGSVEGVLRPLLQPHLDDLADKMQPGLLVLTWTSMNIDGYLHRFHQARGGWGARQCVGMLDRWVKAAMGQPSAVCLATGAGQRQAATHPRSLVSPADRLPPQAQPALHPPTYPSAVPGAYRRAGAQGGRHPGQPHRR